MINISPIKALIGKYPDSDLMKSIQDLPDNIPEEQFIRLVPFWDLSSKAEKNGVSEGTETDGNRDPSDLNEKSVTTI